jgi:hypothetical protein
LSTFLTLPSSLFRILVPNSFSMTSYQFARSSRFPSSSLDHCISFHQALELDYRK